MAGIHFNWQVSRSPYLNKVSSKSSCFFTYSLTVELTLSWHIVRNFTGFSRMKLFNFVSRNLWYIKFSPRILHNENNKINVFIILRQIPFMNFKPAVCFDYLTRKMNVVKRLILFNGIIFIIMCILYTLEIYFIETSKLY